MRCRGHKKVTSRHFTIIRTPTLNTSYETCTKTDTGFALKESRHMFTYVSVFQPGFRGTSGFRRNGLKFPGTKFATTLLCGCSNKDTWIIAWGSTSNANICGIFRCSKKIEKHWRTSCTCLTTIEVGSNFKPIQTSFKNCAHVFRKSNSTRIVAKFYKFGTTITEREVWKNNAMLCQFWGTKQHFLYFQELKMA